MRLEKTIGDLQREQTEITNHVQSIAISDEQIAQMETFCVEVREGLADATFEDKRQYFDLLDVRGKLAFENGEKVVYVTCLIGKQRLVQMQTLPSSSTHNVAPVLITQRLVLTEKLRSHVIELTFAYAGTMTQPFSFSSC